MLFKDKTVLPQFDFKIIKAYNVLGGVNPYSNVSNRFDALEDMKRQIDETDFDIALIDCGAYAFNLAAYVKRKGKKGDSPLRWFADIIWNLRNKTSR